MSTTATPHPTRNDARPPSTASETFSQMQSLAQRIQAMLPTEHARGHVVGVTSCLRQEGVSVVTGNLAVCASEVYGGKVLLVDANPRNASVASRFGVKPTPGLADCLSGKSALQECIASTAHPNLCVLPTGSAAHSAVRLSEQRSAELFENLRQDFALIVVDLPPAGDMDEMIQASQLVDGFLLVLEAERSRRHAVQRVARQFELLNARVLGVVLNKRKNHIPEWLYRRL